MTIHYTLPKSFAESQVQALKKALVHSLVTTGCTFLVIIVVDSVVRSPIRIFLVGLPMMVSYLRVIGLVCDAVLISYARSQEKAHRGGKEVLGAPPQRDCFARALLETRQAGKNILDCYLIGFELETGAPLWISDDDLCTHAAVFAKTGVGKTLWLESLLFQQMLRGRASGCTFIDAKRDSSTLAHIIYMAHVTGRIEDLIVIDPLNPIYSYNFVATHQRPDVKARKVLRAGLPPISDASTAKHYDRLAADAVYRIVRALDSLGLAWSIDDVAVALGSFTIAYPYLQTMLKSMNAQEALLELAHFATTYRTQKGTIDVQKLADNVRGIASELHSIAAGDAGELFCATHSDLRLTEAIAQGKLIYFMLPRLEESEGAARMLKVFREDLEVSIGEITSHEHIRLDDPHLVIIDEGASTFSPTWANLFELARKGRFALLFGAQSTAGLSDPSLGLSSAFYKRVMANVNLKVAMRLGDNETACELSEWMGKKTVIKKSVSHSTSQGRSGAPLTMLNTKLQSGQSSTESFYEETEERVSPDDLKYGLLAEKGLAWVDMGGKLIKMRSLWVDFHLSERWTGRATLPRYEVSEKDSLGLRSFINREVREREIFSEPLKAPASPPDESLLPKAPIEAFKLSSDAPSSLRYRKTLVISPDTAQESQSTIIFPKKIAR